MLLKFCTGSNAITTLNEWKHSVYFFKLFILMCYIEANGIFECRAHFLLIERNFSLFLLPFTGA